MTLKHHCCSLCVVNYICTEQLIGKFSDFFCKEKTLKTTDHPDLSKQQFRRDERRFPRRQLSFHSAAQSVITELKERIFATIWVPINF